ncbi:hypothetical protein RKE30_26590 [Streptomyces sp. Li-HN-5-11]|uniref:hypothetical protein n=1 Tax=Streptomyces sp. Li-HN-5-11 TaxID=3075432 RepID=UPI0028A8216B|nr:hypothetical protein [Streptomyces sp. Li-HN-5-11]WNM33700.1 hypothetical protein RKE30_26590 [Streptomyces sp. Li-HN-5-11]
MLLLFLRKIGPKDWPIPIHDICTLLQDALAATGLADATGQAAALYPARFRCELSQLDSH